jgi:hypothetical protein
MSRARLSTSALFLALSACVVPVAPDFEDPEENFAPYLITSNPSPGSIITAVGRRAPPLSVTVADPNHADKLYVRWIFNYPTFQSTTSNWDGPILPPPTNGRDVRDPFNISADCDVHNIFKGGLRQHRMMLAVSDREFLPPDEAEDQDFRLTAVPKEARLLRLIWTLNMDCSIGP